MLLRPYFMFWYVPLERSQRSVSHVRTCYSYYTQYNTARITPAATLKWQTASTHRLLSRRMRYYGPWCVTSTNRVRKVTIFPCSLAGLHYVNLQRVTKLQHWADKPIDKRQVIKCLDKFVHANMQPSVDK